MGDTPTTTNETAKTVEEIISIAIYDVALKLAETAIIAEVPWLGLPVVSTIFDFFLKIFCANYLYKFLAQVATFEVIDFQTDAEKVAYADAEANLRAAHLSGDPNAINKATSDFKTALASLIHWDGSAST